MSAVSQAAVVNCEVRGRPEAVLGDDVSDVAVGCV